jgi:fucose 4-O-acetylase-like acetyltransferase
MSFQRACAFMPFFFIGYYAHKEGRVEKMRQWNKLPFAFIFVGMCSLCYFYLPIFYSNSCYENVADCGMRVLQLGVASLMCIALLNIVPKAMGKFTEMGKHTLIIYLLHPPMIKVMNVACLYFGIGRTPLIAIIMCTISVTLIYFVRNMIFFKYLR